MEAIANELKVLIKVVHDFWWLPLQFIWWRCVVFGVSEWEEKRRIFKQDIEDLIN